eukprot:930798-Prymnesium_polylepis.1
MLRSHQDRLPRRARAQGGRPEYRACCAPIKRPGPSEQRPWSVVDAPCRCRAASDDFLSVARARAQRRARAGSASAFWGARFLENGLKMCEQTSR